MSLEEYRARRARLGFTDNPKPIIPLPETRNPPLQFRTTPPEPAEPPVPEISGVMKCVESELAEIIERAEHQRVPIRQIKERVRAAFGLRRGELEGPSRARYVVVPRQICMYLCTRYALHNSLPMIGREHGGRDHTTVLHARNKIAAWLRGEGKL